MAPKKQPPNKRLDPELAKEIVSFVIECHREEEAKAIKARHDKKRANIKLLLRKYRDIVEHVDNAIFDAAHLDDDLQLQDILELMSGNRHEPFRVESIRKNVATARIIVGHMVKMLESYRLSCEMSGKDEDKRRYRVIHDMYIAPAAKTVDEIALDENIDKSTVYRDIDAAAERLAVLFFGVFGLRFL